MGGLTVFRSLASARYISTIYHHFHNLSSNPKGFNVKPWHDGWQMVLTSVPVHQVSRRRREGAQRIARCRLSGGSNCSPLVSDLMLNGNVLMLKPGGKWEEGRLKDGLACLVGG